MTKTKIYILAGGFFVLLLFALYDMPFVKKIFEKKSAEEKMFEEFSPNEIKRIELDKNQNLIVFEKVEGDWMIIGEKEYKADSKQVKKIIETVKNIKKEQVVSQNIKKRNKFHVDSSLGFPVKFVGRKGETKIDFFIGKNGPSWNSMYIAKRDSKEVVLLSQNIRHIFDKPLNEFRDKTIFSFNKNQLKIVAVKYDGEKISLEKKEGKWIMDGKEIEIKDFFKTVSSLQAIDFSIKKDIGDQILKIYMEFEKGRSEVLYVGDKQDENRYLARKEGDNNIYVVAKEDVDKLKIDKKNLEK